MSYTLGTYILSVPSVLFQDGKDTCSLSSIYCVYFILNLFDREIITGYTLFIPDKIHYL